MKLIHCDLVLKYMYFKHRIGIGRSLGPSIGILDVGATRRIRRSLPVTQPTAVKH